MRTGIVGASQDPAPNIGQCNLIRWCWRVLRKEVTGFYSFSEKIIQAAVDEWIIGGKGTGQAVQLGSGQYWGPNMSYPMSGPLTCASPQTLASVHN